MTKTPHPESLAERERRGVFRNVATTAFGQAGAIVFGLGAMVVTTRLLGPSGYGSLAVFFMVLGVVTQVALSWPNAAVVRFGRVEIERDGTLGGVFWARTVLYVACLAGSGLVLFLFGRAISGYLGLGSGGVVLLFVYAAVLSGVEMFGVVFQALGKFRAVAWLAAAPKAMTFAALCTVYLGLVDRAVPPRAVLTVHVVSLGIVLVVAGLRAAFCRIGPFGVDAACLRRMTGYAWPVMFGGLAGVVVGWVDTAVLKHYRPMTDVGTYAAAYQVVIVLEGLRAAVLSVLWPLIMSTAAKDRRGALTWYLDEFLPVGVVLAGFGLAVLSMVCEAIPWVLGSPFAPSVLLGQVLIVGQAALVIRTLTVNVANAYDRVKHVVATSIVVALVNLAGDLILVPRMGPMGAALATVSAYGVGSLLVLWVVNGVGEVRGAAPSRRFVCVFGLVPVLGPALLWMWADTAPLRIVTSLTILGAWCLTVRALGWVRPATLRRLARGDLPGPARAVLRCLSASLCAEEVTR